ncbi:22372_t:CDS:1, partial [Racocetra persica]
QDFANWLLQLGEDRPEHTAERDDYIKLPDDILLPFQNIQDFINFVYPDLTSVNTNSSYFVNR